MYAGRYPYQKLQGFLMIFLKFSYYYMTEKIGKMAEDSTNKKTENLVGSLQTEFPYAMCRYRIIVF